MTLCIPQLFATQNFRALSRIFGLGGKMLKVTVDGGCSHRPQFSRGVWGHAPPPPEGFLILSLLSGSEAF